MRSLHLPVWLGALGWGRGVTFAALTTAETTSRALLTTVVPLQAYAKLGSAQQVSLLFFGFSIAGLATSLCVPWLMGRLARRWLFTLAAVAGIAGSLLMIVPTLPALMAGMVLRAFAAACLDVMFNLYVLDHIARREMGRFEPLRVLFQAVPWALGPWLGIYLQESLGLPAPYIAAAACGVAGLGYFWVLRLRDDPAVTVARPQPTNPVRYLPRFVAQPRLRLAWVLAFGRASWWTVFFIYAPIYAVISGLGEETGGLIVSAGAASLLLVPLWGHVGRRHGIRRLLITGYGLSGLATLTVALVMGWPWLCAVTLVLAGLVTTTIDGGGNILFLRAVRPFERPSMTTVFSTYRDASSVVPPGVIALLLKVFELPAVFVVGGLGMGTLALLSRHIPRRM